MIDKIHDRGDTDHGHYISLFWIAGNFQKLSYIGFRKSQEVIEAILETSFKFINKINY